MASASFAWRDDREDEAKRAQVATDVVTCIMNTPDKGIRQEMMESAVCAPRCQSRILRPG
jgi:hypothetical protein